jgi:o-succinylbenzoate synthase
MKLKAEYKKHILNFKFDAGTSRGVMKTKETFILKISFEEANIIGYGECSLLRGLSSDDVPDYEEHLAYVCNEVSKLDYFEDEDFFYNTLVDEIIGRGFPSIIFGFETAFFDLWNGGKFQVFENGFYNGEFKLPINGLIWMGNKKFMLEQVSSKLDEGFSCIKMKIGAINFEEECEILKTIRSRYDEDRIILRVDANGAFDETNAMDRLNILSRFKLHSIEQPVKPGQYEFIKFLCIESPVPVALDEELIGINNYEDKKSLLEKINPPYIILKPSLLGGYRACDEWIKLAQEMEIGWWITSALESNIGLNGICQYAANFDKKIVHGLGTGKLYHNNFDSPLFIKEGEIGYDPRSHWEEIF